VKNDSLDPMLLLPRAIDNSQIVREVDPRASRHLWLLLGLVASLVAGMALYAWPRLEAQRLDEMAEQMQRQRERLLEQNRKLRLEKASLENLERVQAIATRELGFATPEPERIFTATLPARLPEGTRFVSAPDSRPTRVN
jgi:cell division protein FtsL